MSSSEKGPTVHTKHLTMFLGKNSIINKDGKEWKIHRKNMTRTFSAETVDNLDEPVRKETSKIIGALFEKLDSDANEEYRMNGEIFSAAIVSRIVGTVFFGFELGGSVLERDELSVKYTNLLEEFDRRMKSPFNPAARLYSLPTASNIKYKNDHRYARQMFLDTLKKHSKRNDSGTTDSWKGRSDFLMAILDFVVEEQGYSIDDDEIQNMVNAAYLFSIESLSTTVQYMIYSIQQNPGFEQKCLKEINALLDRTGTVDVDQLPYCDAFITEVLRLYPVIPFSWRQLESPLKLGNTTLPTGMKVYVPFFLLHRDERNFPRPTELLPERWVQHSSDGGWEDRDDSKGNKELADADGVTQDTDADPIPAGLRQNLFTFGKGGRGCPGMKIAKKEACILFTELIRHFKFEVEPGYVLKPSVKGVGQKPLGGIPFIVRRR
jgi:cytochrome P450